MKKSQRARLAELTNKAEAERSAVEKAEFAFLSALATAHPDAGKDVDDTSPGAAGNAAPAATAAASPAAGAAAPPVAAAPAATAPAAVVAPAGTLRGFIQSLRGGAAVGADLVAARATITTLTTERDQARQESAATAAQLATATAQLSAFSAFFGITTAELAKKTGAEVTALIGAKISEQAVEQVAALGVPVGQLPTPTKGESAGDTFAEKMATFNAMPAGKEKDAFYNREIAPGFATAGKN